MYRIGKKFHFSAAHCLDHLPEDHPCHRLHGHNYIVELVFDADELNSDSFIIDYREMTDFKGLLDSLVDHRNLNDVMYPVRTTAENIAQWVFELVRMKYPSWPLSMVRVSETDKTFAEYWV